MRSGTLGLCGVLLGLGCGGATDAADATSDDVAATSGDEASAGDAAGDPEPGGDDAEPPPHEDPGPIAEVPFAATVIRDATPAGRTYTFQFREDGRVRWERWVFSEVSPTGWVSESTPVNEQGEPTGETERADGTWQELEHHAHFPLDATEITNAVLTLPLARFRCRLYTVTSTDDAGRPVVARFWFATDLPGAPVRMVREIDGETVVEMQLVAHEPPLP